MVYAARVLRLDSFTIWDHFQDLFPKALWGTDFSWLARDSESPHELFDYQTILGYLAAHAGRLRLGVTVTEPVRRHPVLLAQAMLTLAHVSKKAPILGIGSGEAENIVPYGLPFDQPVGRLEEALQILRLCFDGSVDQAEQASANARPVGGERRKLQPEIARRNAVSVAEVQLIGRRWAGEELLQEV